MTSKEEYLNFDWETYYNIYKKNIIQDLEIDVKTKEVTWHHWKYFGKKKDLQFFTIDSKIIDGIDENNDVDSFQNYENTIEYKIFDWKQYIKNYEDLQKKITTHDVAWKHWCKYGKRENRTYKNILKELEQDSEYKNFDWESYIDYYPDLQHFKTKFDAWDHWIKHGSQEKRTYFNVTHALNAKNSTNSTNSTPICSSIQINNAPPNSQTGSKYNIASKNKHDLWKTYFYKFNHNYKYNATSTIAVLNEINLHCQLLLGIEKNNYPKNKLIKNEEDYVLEPDVIFIYITKLVKDNLAPINTNEEKDLQENYISIDLDLYKNSDDKKLHENIFSNMTILKNFYKNNLDTFMDLYNIQNEEQVFKVPHIEFRYFCFNYLDFMRNFFIKNTSQIHIELNKPFEAVFIEFRNSFPHVEFLLRNAIMRVGNEWSYTVICGNLNYNSIITICNSISKNIKVIKTEYDNLCISEYNKFLKGLDFWNLLHGEKILIFQEDTFIFNNNINNFIAYDYVGAPWVRDVLPINVGNGGLSLRSKRVMKNIIKNLSNDDTFINEEIAEDTFFSKHMQRLKIGKIADYNTASYFSSELICNNESFGGHKFWLSDELWKERMYKSLHKYIDTTTI